MLGQPFCVGTFKFDSVECVLDEGGVQRVSKTGHGIGLRTLNAALGL